MEREMKGMLMLLMTTALFFGFLPIHLGAMPYNFERLHVFLFNLCSGGFVILHYTREEKKTSPLLVAYLMIALFFAVVTFFKLYCLSVGAVFVLALIVESMRIRRFSFLPWDFFRRGVKTSRRFHQASLLCLSAGLVISGLVMYNNYWGGPLHYPRLDVDVFFLGFSFPISLITMSVMFSFMEDQAPPGIRLLLDLNFWAVNLGVIVFFLFIIFEMLVFQLLAASLLACSVTVIFLLFLRYGSRVQQHAFLTSGMTFLFFTALTGIAYILLKAMGDPGYYRAWGKFILSLHAFIALYGWNLAGLLVIIRREDFPLRLDSRPVIMFHWVVVVVLAPMGKLFFGVGVAASLLYGLLLYLVLFSPGRTRA